MEPARAGDVESTHRTITLLRCKTAIIGDAHVGKSALTQMFHSGGTNFPKNYIMTTDVEFCVKVVNIPDAALQVELYMFDTAGQTIFGHREHGSKHWEGLSAAIVVYDVSDRDSFNACTKWLARAQAVRRTTHPIGVLIANKVDLREAGRAVVTTEEGMELARANGLEYFETAAASGTDVDAPFHFVADAFSRKYSERVRAVEHGAI